jgi:hypothetical protein
MRISDAPATAHAREEVSVTVRVRNTDAGAKEVVQVFLSRPPAKRANRSPA